MFCSTDSKELLEKFSFGLQTCITFSIHVVHGMSYPAK